MVFQKRHGTELVIDNLMIDLETAVVTLLDWSAAKVEHVLCPALGEVHVKNEFFQIRSQLKRNKLGVAIMYHLRKKAPTGAF